MWRYLDLLSKLLYQERNIELIYHIKIAKKNPIKWTQMTLERAVRFFNLISLRKNIVKFRYFDQL